jgi:glucoamylase
LFLAIFSIRNGFWPRLFFQCFAPKFPVSIHEIPYSKLTLFLERLWERHLHESLVMLPVIAIVCVSYFILYAFASTIPQYAHQIPLSDSLHAEQTHLGVQFSLEAWLNRQESISLERLLDNISPGGKHAEHTVPGTVLASPSQEHPDYFYQWIRDAGITLGTLVDIYAQNATSEFSQTRLEPIMDAYVRLSSKIQKLSNPSGSFGDLSSLGEPKFNVDGTPFTGNWGRPQRDGPALRALTLIAYLRAYNASHPTLWTAETRETAYAELYSAALPPSSVIKADLEYTARYWNDDGFDLWEEVNGKHFFTAMVQLRALREGAEIADAFGDHAAAKWYLAQALSIERLTKRFWSEEKGHLVATLDQTRNGLDCALPLGAIHGTGTLSSPFQPHSDEILVSLLYFIQDQRKRFPINSEREESGEDELAGTGLGRYPSDVYDGYTNSDRGGNPWFICTATAGEIFYHTAIHIRKVQKLSTSSRGLPFWKSLLPGLNVEANQDYSSESTEFKTALQRLQEAGDSFLNIVRVHSAGDGSLSEQFDRETGYERGARDLTWSYGAFLQASEVRRQLHAMT